MMRQLRWLPLVVLAFILSSCGTKQKPQVQEEKAQTKEEIIQDRYNSVKRDLEFENEKILLLSLIRSIDYEKAFSILTDYYVYEYDFDFGDDISKPKMAIERIAEKHSISASKVASLIFSFKYEMITRDEIEEGVIENIEESRYDDYEEETPEYY